MRITLIRHGKTAGNSELRYIGQTDEPLAPDGVAHLKTVEADFTVKTVHVSPLQRTRQTAEILFPNAEQIVVDALQEMNFGDFEGCSYNEMADDAAYRAWVDSDCLAPCPNGESRSSFSSRICAAFTEVLAQAENQGDPAFVFVVHGGTIMAIMERFAVPHKNYYDYSVKNCSGYICDVIWNEQEILTLNNVTLWG